MPRWTDDQREEVVRRVERHARLRPRDFRARVMYLVLIGYAYILAVFLFDAHDEERITGALDDALDTDVAVYAFDGLSRSLQARLLAIAGEPFYRPAVAR